MPRRTEASTLRIAMLVLATAAAFGPAAPAASAADVPDSPAAAPPAVPAPAAALVRYSFDDGTLASGPDTFAVFEKSKGRVHLSTTFPFSGYRSVEIRDVAGDGAFPELQGYFPLRDKGVLYAHFALMTADPAEQLNVALAGPEKFTLRRGGIAFWLQTRGGYLCHYTDSIPVRLLPLRPFAWYLVDVAYDIAAGLYDLTVSDAGGATLVTLARQPNAFSLAGSGVDTFSFIGDNGHDTSNVDYFVDDVVLSADVPVVAPGFVAPGRRKLFFDILGAARGRRRAVDCPPLLDPSDLGFGPAEIDAWRTAGLLPALDSALQGRAPGPPPAGTPRALARALEGLAAYTAGCAALRRGDAGAALGRFQDARATLDGPLLSAAGAVALAALGRRPEAEQRLADLHVAWKDDPRLPLVLATTGAASDIAAAASRLAEPAEDPGPDETTSNCVLVALSVGLDSMTPDIAAGLFPEAWRRCLASALVAEEHFYALLLRREAGAAERYAARLVDRLRAADLPAAPWIERLGDARFAAGDHAAALRFYEESAAGRGPRPALMLKLSDVHYLLGDAERERSYREAIYGSLHEEQGHPNEAD